MMNIDQIKECLSTLHKEFGTTKFAVTTASTILGACVGFTAAAIGIPNNPITENVAKEI